MLRNHRVDTYDPQGNLVETKTVQYETSPEFDNEESLRTEGRQTIANLRTIAATTGTLTGLQLSNAVRVLARATLVLVRLQLRELDSTD